MIETAISRRFAAARAELEAQVKKFTDAAVTALVAREPRIAEVEITWEPHDTFRDGLMRKREREMLDLLNGEGRCLTGHLGG